MLELRKMNYEDAAAQWAFVTALPGDENGFTNPYEGVSFEDYLHRLLSFMAEPAFNRGGYDAE